MVGLDAPTLLLLGVAGIVVLNRTFTSSGLKRLAWAYVLIQAIDVVACTVLVLWRMDQFPLHLDLSVRTFLVLFVAWHMVQNNAERVADARRRREDEERRAAVAARRAQPPPAQD